MYARLFNDVNSRMMLTLGSSSFWCKESPFLYGGSQINDLVMSFVTGKYSTVKSCQVRCVIIPVNL